MWQCVAGTGLLMVLLQTFTLHSKYAACMLMQPLQMLEVTPCQALVTERGRPCTPQKCWLTIDRPALQPLQGTPGDPGQALRPFASTPRAGCHVDTRRVLPPLTPCQLQVPYWRAGSWLHLAAPLSWPTPLRGGSSGVWRLQVHSRGGARADAGGGRRLHLGGGRSRPAGRVGAHVGTLGSVAEVCGGGGGLPPLVGAAPAVALQVGPTQASRATLPRSAGTSNGGAIRGPV